MIYLLVYWLVALYIFAGVTYLRSLFEIEKLGKELDSIFSRLSTDFTARVTGRSNRTITGIFVVLLWPFLSLIAICRRT